LEKKIQVILIGIIALASLSFLAPFITYADSLQFEVNQIDHCVTPIYGGLLYITDTVKITPTEQDAEIEEFLIGFPIEYRENFRLSMAYGAEDNEPLEIVSNTGLGTIGYHGITVVFPEEVREQLYNGQSYTFEVTFVFSNLIDSTTQIINATNEYVFTSYFPLYPSLPVGISFCNVTVVLPENAKLTSSGFLYNTTQKDEKIHLNHTVNDLMEFAYNTTSVRFSYETANNFAIFSTDEKTREIQIDSNGQITASEIFLLTGRTPFVTDKIQLVLPKDATNVTSFDEQGKQIGTKLLDENDTYEISLRLVKDQSRSFTITYAMGLADRARAQAGSQDVEFTIIAMENLRILPEELTIKIIFPEGATIKAFPQDEFTIQRDVFQDQLSLTLSNVTRLQEKQWNFIYTYTIFWDSFRPTLWTTALVLVGTVVAFAWRRPKAAVTTAVVLVPHKILNEFYESYETKKRIITEIEQLKGNARKGKVSRRKYKIRKTTLDNRLATLSKKLAELQRNIMSGGAKYADMMRRLEVAETELDNIDEDIKRIEVRFKRGEISAQTYRRLLEDDLRRREKSRTTIDGVLLRLRE